MSEDEFWSLTEAQFELLEEDYWSKQELEERRTANILAHFTNLWVNQGKKEGEEPLVHQPEQFMDTLSRKKFKGWVKTVDGWIREEDFDNAQHMLKQKVISKL